MLKDDSALGFRFCDRYDSLAGDWLCKSPAGDTTGGSHIECHVTSYPSDHFAQVSVRERQLMAFLADMKILTSTWVNPEYRA
jgi:hypothetical protein